MSGLDFPDDGRGLAFLDLEGDGDLDVAISNRTAPRLRLMRNELPAGDRFVALRLGGNGAGTNRDAVGARVEVPTSSGTLRRSVRAGEGFLSQSSRWLHFGLGDGEVSGPVRVSWPGGGSETFAGVAAGGRYRIVQGSGRGEPAPARPRPAALEPREQQVPAPTTGSRVVLAPRPPAPSLTLRLFDASEPVPVEAGQGRPVLVNIWASWCVPCRFELQDLADEADALRAAGLEIAALSTDGMGEVATTTEEAARKFMDEIGLSVPCTGWRPRRPSTRSRSSRGPCSTGASRSRCRSPC